MINLFRIYLATIVSALLFFCFSSASASEWIVRFTIPTVGQSSQKVSSALQAVEGVADVEVSQADVTVSFESDDTDTETLQNKLAAAGFPVKKTNILQQG